MALSVTMCRTFVVVLLALAGVHSQVSVQLTCSPGWTLDGDQCYRLYTSLLSWQSASEVCRIDGANLPQIGDIYTNKQLGRIATASGVTNFWIGLNRISVPVSNTSYLEWSDGAPSSIYQAFWEELQPDLSAGSCVYVSESHPGHYRWSLGPCEWKRAFMCELPACPSGSFQCSTGECIQSSRTCDGTQDCDDGSDEINCLSLCKEYLTGSGGNILSPNYPGSYPILNDCQWTIEGPIGSNILLQVNNIDTQSGVDELVVMGGGRTASFSQNLARLSGVTASPDTVRSSNNFMIVRFYSDGAIQGTGFNLTWTAVETGIQDAGQQLTASRFVRYLRSPTYLSNQETVWVINTPHARTIITLEVFISNQRRKMDLAPGDMIYVRDGGDASAPLLAQYSGTSGPLYVISTGPQLYIFMKTVKNTGVTNAGFEFRYYTGCVVSLHENNGELFSPGYGVVNYANYVTCTYTISPISAQKTTLRFDSTYDIEFQNDKLQVFIGVDDNGNPMHSTADGGYTGTVAPRPVSSVSGRIYVRFQTNAIDDRLGWRATYSQGCQNPNFNSDTILTPSASYNYGDTFNVSCPVGFGFSSLEFYTKQQDGALVSLTSVYMECVFGGTWNVRNTPQCVRKYCSQAPEISNGYVQSATGAVFGSTASYVCAEGYTAVGNTDITCQQDGTWQSPPTCAVVTCPAISTDILDGTSQLTLGNRFAAGTVYTFTCNAGHMISGSPIVNCNSSGVWTYPVPTCQKLQCPTPTLANGNVFASGLSFINVGVTLAVNCITAGYQLVGSSTITCQGNQTFTTLPVCQDLDECFLKNPCHVEAVCTNTDGSYTCTCRSGFQQNGALCDDVNECNSNNGGCSDTCDNVAGSYTCSCPPGSTLFTQNQTMGYAIPASETGLRFGDTYYIDHTCVRNQCPTPSAIPNGYLTEKRVLYSFGDTVTFSCAPGYVLTGQTTLLCQANGTWSAEIPTCEVAKCPADVIPQNLINNPTSVSPSGEVNFGAVVTITCNVPGVGVFTKTRTCRFDPGQQVYRLQGDSYECGVVNCGQPLLPTGGLILRTLTNTTYGATFEFYCNFNYEVAGSNNLGTNTITCAADSYWTFFNITCLERQCPFPGVPAGGDVSFEGNGYDYYDNVTFTCQRSGFEPEVGAARCGVAENNQSLDWGIPTPPKCLDVEPPSFTNCPSSPVSVSRYASAGFPVPNAQDNSGSVKSVTVSPAYFYPTQPVDQDITVTYNATDHAGLTDVCVVNIVVKDETPPSIQCPGEEVIRLSVSQSAYSLFDPNSANVTYNSNDAVLNFTPSAPLNYSYAEVGTSTIFTATVKDSSGNSASCQFQVVIEALLCESNTLKSANTISLCQSTNSGGQSCTFTCDSGFYFYEDYPTESFTSTCEPGQPYNSSYVPSCVESAPVLFNMAITLQYQASPSAEILEICQQAFNTSLITQLSGLGATFKQPCAGQQNIAAVTYNQGSLQSTYDSNNQQLQVQFTLLFESPGGSDSEQEYSQCYDNLRSEFLKLSQNTGALLTLRNLTSPGCPDVFGTSISETTTRTCSSDYKYRNPNNTAVCLPCPPGTTKSAAGTCDLCAVGEYWVTANASLYGQCVSCSRGQATAGEGSIGVESCIEQCDGNLVSSSGIPPCRECTGNSFALNSTYCQKCPANTLALRKETPLNASCNNPEDV
ncbi:CUB and sushi domain-containing protein 3-like [Littorina saxatilis]|uniref:CUB and sushi domain-containing protein 3-like n=1 Tax=Littorina saxatilis TaxID=31220 RepID=UPI0038B4FA2C